MRVPTYQNYMNMLNLTMRNKATFELYNYQSLSGLKSPTYAGYGMQAFNIVSLEASLKVSETFTKNNKVTETEVLAMNTSLESTYKIANEFKVALNAFNGNSLNTLTPDYTGGQLRFSDDNATYVGQTITVDSVQYTFANGSGANLIDISGLTQGTAGYADAVMNALYTQLPSNPDYSFDGSTFTFPLYTINGSSSVLNVSGVETGEPYTMSQEQSLTLNTLQNLAFSTMMMLADNLNVNVNGQYVFGGGVSNQAPINFPFHNLEEFQAYYDGINIQYPSNVSGDLSNWGINTDDTGALTMELVSGNEGTITASNIGGFMKEAIKANSSTTGDLTFNTDKNTIKASEYGAFNTLHPGDTLILQGNTGGNNNTYIIKEISTDGKTIILDESTPINVSTTVSPNDDITFNTSFPVGSVINMNGFGNNISPKVQVTGISPDGSTLYITVDPSRFPSPAETFPPSSKLSLTSQSYYRGGDLVTEKRVSETQSLVFDINASDPAFEKLFRALGEIAQGNLVDTRNPKDDLSTNIDSKNAPKRTSEALDLLYDAIYNSGKTVLGRNEDLQTIMSKVSSNYIILNNTMENQALVQNNLKDGIYSLKNVDETEAATKALVAGNNLQASYAVLQNAMSISLLNYLK